MSQKSNLSVQQLPKEPKFLSAFEAKPGHSLVYIDFSALEPHVLTEFSNDLRMKEIYGPHAKPGQDIYLYFGYNTALFGPAIKAYYNPRETSLEATEIAKKHLKTQRDILKIIVLGIGYGMGANKLKEDVNVAGYKIEAHEARKVVNDYKDFFWGVERFKIKLENTLSSNGGYIINGRGRILTIPSDKTKDIVNRFVQSTGHDILMYYLLLINRKRKERNIPMRPWQPDEHDATIWEVPDEYAQQVKEVFEECLVELNETLSWGIKFKGNVKIAKDLSVKL